MSSCTTSYLGSGKRFEAFVQIIEAAQQRIQLLYALNCIRSNEPFQHHSLTFEGPFLELKLRSEEPKLEWFAKTLIVCAFEKGVQGSMSAETQEARNGLRYMNCLQDLGILIEEVIKRNNHLMIAEAFWRIRRTKDRHQEHKLFLRSFSHAFQKLIDRRIFLMIPDKPTLKVVPDELIKAVVSLEEIAINRIVVYKKWSFLALRSFFTFQRKTEKCSGSFYDLWKSEFFKRGAENEVNNQNRSQQNSFAAFIFIKKLEKVVSAFLTKSGFDRFIQQLALKRAHRESDFKGLKNLLVLFNCFSIEQKRRVWNWLVQHNYRSQAQLQVFEAISPDPHKSTQQSTYVMWRIRACTIVLQDLFRRRMIQYFRSIRKSHLIPRIKKPEKIIYARTSDLPRRSLLENVPILIAPENFSSLDRSRTPRNRSVIDPSAASPLIKRSIGQLNSACAERKQESDYQSETLWLGNRKRSFGSSHP